MRVEQIIFYALAAMVLGSALLVVTIRNLVRSIFLFFVSLISLSGLYIFASADFIAIAQIVIYVGGVLVLMLFAFLLSNKELLNNLSQPVNRLINISSLPGFLLASVFLFVLISAILNTEISWLGYVQQNHFQPGDNTVHNIGISIMTRYLLPFEAVSIFLMMALIGAAHLARRGQKI